MVPSSVSLIGVQKMKGHESNTKLKDASFLQKVWLSLEFIFLPYHLMMVSLVMILSFITSPALLNIRFQVRPSVFPVTVCVPDLPSK